MFPRHIEHEADRFGLELTHENHAAAMIFVRDAQKELALEWGTFFLIFRADHPPIRERIEFANNYKPWEHGAPLRYSNVCKSEGLELAILETGVNNQIGDKCIYNPLACHVPSSHPELNPTLWMVG